MTKREDTQPSKKKGVTSKAKAIRTITDPRDLFTLLYQRVEAQGPFIAVDKSVVDASREIFETIRDGKYFDIALLLWPNLLRRIQWDRQSDDAAHRCSLGTLIFIGHVQQVILRNMGTTIPLPLAIEILIRLSKLESSFEGWHAQSRSWIKTTREGAEKLGMRFDKKMRRDDEDHDFWDWYGHCGDT
jgi:hypothetical protein